MKVQSLTFRDGRDDNFIKSNIFTGIAGEFAVT